jgi:telomere length regulation protein
VLLLSAGYVHRIAPVKLSMLVRSSTYLNAVSNRLAASSTRARFLGMIVGEALSALVENPEKRMNFKTEELENTEAQWYKSLTGVKDSIGSISMLRNEKLVIRQNKKIKTRIDKSGTKPVTQQANTKIFAIQELDDDKSEDDDLVPYAKPDSDAEDSDEDPTLVQRNKPTAPVYIRDLIVFLRDTENFDRQKLALATASSLIRRKSNFGTEVRDHVEELATLLVGLQDKFDMENFQDMRLQGMIAVLLSEPSKMGKWFSNTFFEGDYSIAQRASVLAVLSISARELGGFKEQDSSVTKLKPVSENSFPSKLLPERLHKLYAPERQLQSPVDVLSQQLSNTMIQPLAASLADKFTGPDVLKVRTFSSRLAVESRRKAPTSNALSKVVANSFFFPLTGRFFVHFKAYGSKNVIFEPYLLSSFLKTLSLILHASGPLTLQLPQMTSEMWDLLLSLRTQGQADRSIGEALLFAFITLLEINEDKRSLAEAHGKELLETQAWVELFFTNMGTGTDEDDKMRALAAGVLFKISEVVEKYQALLMGDLSSF